MKYVRILFITLFFCYGNSLPVLVTENAGSDVSNWGGKIKKVVNAPSGSKNRDLHLVTKRSISLQKTDLQFRINCEKDDQYYQGQETAQKSFRMDCSGNKVFGVLNEACLQKEENDLQAWFCSKKVCRLLQNYEKNNKTTVEATRIQRSGLFDVSYLFQKRVLFEFWGYIPVLLILIH